MITSRVVLAFLAWMGCAVVCLAVASVALEAPKYYALANRGIETKGVVVTKEPENHSFIRYSYHVNQQQYMDVGSAGGLNPSFEDLNPGDPVAVYYDPKKPGSSLLGDPKPHFASILRGIVFVTLIGPTFSVLGLLAKGWLPPLRKAKPLSANS